MDISGGVWKKCSNCKTNLAFGVVYYRCNVSTCNHERTGLQFCSVSCWSAHVPIYRHRDAWALEETAPTSASSIAKIDTPATKAAPLEKKETIYINAGPGQVHARLSQANDENDILVVASKLKSFIKNNSDMNTSADVLETLSGILRRLSLDAIQRARADGRKTVMARDFAK